MAEPGYIFAGLRSAHNMYGEQIRALKDEMYSVKTKSNHDAHKQKKIRLDYIELYSSQIGNLHYFSI